MGTSCCIRCTLQWIFRDAAIWQKKLMNVIHQVTLMSMGTTVRSIFLAPIFCWYFGECCMDRLHLTTDHIKIIFPFKFWVVWFQQYHHYWMPVSLKNPFGLCHQRYTSPRTSLNMTLTSFSCHLTPDGHHRKKSTSDRFTRTQVWNVDPLQSERIFNSLRSM